MTSWPFECVLSKCPLEVKWSACYILPESPEMQIVRQLGAANVPWKLNMLHIHQACGELGHCSDGCCVSHHHVKTSNTRDVSNNFTNYWNNKAQSRGKGRKGLDTFSLSWKWIFALYVSFVCMLIFLFLVGNLGL